MTSRIRALTALTARTVTMATTLVAGAAAQAHTGHGHDELSTFQGLLHALREPDHLVMIAIGAIVVGATSPLVLRAATALGRRVAAQVRRLREARRGVAG